MLIVGDLTNVSYQNIDRLLCLGFLHRTVLGDDRHIKCGEDLLGTAVEVNIVDNPTQKNIKKYMIK